MAPDTELLRDVGFIILGIVVFVVPVKSIFLTLIAYLLVAYGVAHTLFRVNLDKTEKKQ